MKFDKKIKLKSITNYFSIFLLIFFTQIQPAHQAFMMTGLILISKQQSYTIPYNTVSFNTQQISFGYVIQSGKINSKEFRLTHLSNQTSVQTTQLTIMFLLDGITTMTVSENVMVDLLIVDYSQTSFMVNMVSTAANTLVSVPLPIFYDST
jgi:hypothetical protein